MKRVFENLRKKWQWLAAQAGFQRAPGLINLPPNCLGDSLYHPQGYGCKAGKVESEYLLICQMEGCRKTHLCFFREVMNLSWLTGTRPFHLATLLLMWAPIWEYYTLVASRIVGPSGRVVD